MTLVQVFFGGVPECLLFFDGLLRLSVVVFDQLGLLLGCADFIPDPSNSAAGVDVLSVGFILPRIGVMCLS